jgi:hypothetical protein
VITKDDDYSTTDLTPDITDPTQLEPTIEPTFEPTPDDIPSMAQPTTTPSATSESLSHEAETLISANETLIDKQTTLEPTQPEPQEMPQIEEPAPSLTPVETPASLPSKPSKSITPVIIVVLLIIAGIGLAAAAFMSQQTAKLKTQLTEITQTLEKQQTTLTPTVSPTVYEIPTPTVTPEATSSAEATPSATPTISSTINQLQPLSLASTALKIAGNRSPNAQLILIKIDNATDISTAVTKYFFRESLQTKKYFYVSITGKGTPEIMDKQIYVTPDDNIPSLNDSVLGNQLGLELDEALDLTYDLCANRTICTQAPVKAQYIKTGNGIIWQLSLYTKGLSSAPLITQINSNTKEILYQSPELSAK